MDNLSIDRLIKNFFGMSLEKQLLFMEEIKKSYYRSESVEKQKTEISDFFATYQKFYNLFYEYFDNISIYLSSADEYKNINSTQRRYLRYNELKNLQSIADNYKFLTYEEEIKYFLYINSISCDTKEELKEIIESHFHPKKINDEEAEQYIELYKIMDFDDQKDFLAEMYNYYVKTRISFYSNDYPASEKIVLAYSEIVKNLFGDDLYDYYEALPNDKKVYIIDKIAKAVNSFKTSYESDLVLKGKNTVKNQKVLTLETCQNNISIKK